MHNLRAAALLGCGRAPYRRDRHFRRLDNSPWRRVQLAEGYRVLNDEVTFEAGRETGEFYGRLLGHGV